jgi:methyl-accepting chemotaxis protein
VTESRLAFIEAHAALFRAVNWKSNNVEPGLIKKAVESSTQSIKRSTELFAAIAADGGAIDPGQVAAVTKALSGYRAGADQTIDMLDQDAFMASMFMNDAHERSVAADGIFKQLVAEITQREAVLNRDANQALQAGLSRIEWAAVIGIVLALALALVLARFISGPVRGLSLAVSRLADGDLDIDIPAFGQQDEIGEMARSVTVLKRNSQEVKRLRADQEALREEAARVRRREMLVVAETFESKVGQVVRSLSAAAGELENSAKDLSGQAARGNQQAVDLAATTGQASTNVSVVAAGAEELATAATEVGAIVANSAGISKKAVADTEQADKIVQALSDSAQRIGEIVQLISRVADQTNLLALNATIEAARAGAQGRGFAVVAAEVKSLARQTAEATDEIRQQISEIQRSTDDAVQAIRSVGATIGELHTMAQAIASSTDNQRVATQTIARNVAQAAEGTRAASAGADQVRKVSEATGAAARKLLGAARGVSQDTDALMSEVESVLQSIRAA